MFLAYSTNAFTRTDLISALNHVADLGYSGVEILCERPHWYPSDIGENEIAIVKEALSARRLKISNLNANTANSYFSPSPPENVFEPSLTHRKAEVRQAREDIVCQAIKLAARIGAPCVSVTAGHPAPGCLPEQAIDYFVESLKKICAFAEDYHVKIGIEYEPGLLVERASELCEVIRRVGSPLLGANLDIGHSFLIGEDPEATVAALAGRIWNVHVEDIKNMKHYHLVPGDGDLPFERYFKALQQARYDGFLTVELYSFPQAPIEAGERSIAYLSALLSKLNLYAE